MKFSYKSFDYKLHWNGLLIGDKLGYVPTDDGKLSVEVELRIPKAWPGNWPFLIAAWYERRKGVKITA